MSHLSLYRLYRPKTFKEVIGQEFITHSLMNAIKTNRVVHAYIFAGSRGTGKTSIAKIFAKALNCLSPINGDACEQCEHCKLINANQSIDIIELDAASNNGIDDVRHIIETAQFLPSTLNKKVYIIDEAHMLTTAAWNALLKIIEEAPKHVIFILATTELHKIPSTIVSRCQQYLFNRLNNQNLTKLINDVCQKQNIKIDNESIYKIINLADGSARDTLSIIEQISVYSNNDITINKLEKVFGLLDDYLKIDFIKCLINGETKNLITKLDDYLSNGVNLTQLAYDLINIFIDKLVYLQTNDLEILKTLNKDNINSFELSVKQVIEIINIWLEAYGNIKTSNNTRFYFELAIFKSLKIFDNLNDVHFAANKQQAPNNHPISTTLKDVVQINTSLPPLSDVVIEKEVKFDSQEMIKNNENDFDLKTLFFQIASNNTSELKQFSESKFNELKNSQIQKLNNLIRPANKVITASKNGVVILFEDEVDAKLFNEFTKTYDGLIQINKTFGRLVYLVGYIKNDLSTYTNQYIELQRNGQKFNEPDISILDKIIKSKNSITQLAFDIFS